MSSHKAVGLSAVFVAVFVLAKCEGYPIKSSAESGLSQALGMVTSPETEVKSKERPRAKSRHRRYRDHPELEDDDLQMVTIDLSALRPSLPGLVLYKYGEQAPKLVQVDLDSLNPRLQPHVIWPEFTRQADLGDTYYDFVRENLDANEDIPFLAEEESLAPLHHPQMARMTTTEAGEGWPNLNDLADGDIYDFLPGSFRNEELMTLQHSLPLADEVIVPLDWEEGSSAEDTIVHKDKKNVFVSRGWKPGGEPHPHREKASSGTRQYSRGKELSERAHYSSPFGSNGWRPGKRQHEVDNRNIEKEEETYEKTRYVSPTRKNAVGKEKTNPSQSPIRSTAPPSKVQGQQKPTTSAQESWDSPRNKWRVPHFTTRY